MKSTSGRNNGFRKVAKWVLGVAAVAGVASGNVMANEAAETPEPTAAEQPSVVDQPAAEPVSENPPAPDVTEKQSPTEEPMDQQTPAPEVTEKESPSKEPVDKQTPSPEVTEKESPSKEPMDQQAPILDFGGDGVKDMSPSVKRMNDGTAFRGAGNGPSHLGPLDPNKLFKKSANPWIT